MRTIYKYQLLVQDEAVIEMPWGAQVLSVQFQHGNLCMWVLVSPNAEKRPRKFKIFGTGHPIEESPSEMFHVATVQQDGGLLVWHVFEFVEGF